MAAWYEPEGGGYAPRADCVAQILDDIEDYMTTDADGNVAFDIDGFLILAADRLADIPDPTDPIRYSYAEGLRSTNLRGVVEDFQSTLAGLETSGEAPDLTAALADLKAKSDAVTAYYSKAYATGIKAAVEAPLESGALDGEIPEADDMSKETRYYITTFVSDWEEESAPSEVSELLEVGKKDTVDIARGTVPSGRHIAHWRAYRSNSGSQGAAFHYVPNEADELGIPVATATFEDETPNSGLQEVCPSMIWDEPPENLAGLVGMANGINVGFFDQTLCPTPAFTPHAFPTDFRKTVKWPIVGLCAWGQAALVGTTGKPYFLLGNDPAALTLEELDANQACVSARSMCATAMGVLFASPDGLCLATPGSVRVVTAQHFTREEWQALDPANLQVAEHDGVVFMVFADAMYSLDVGSGKLTTLTLNQWYVSPLTPVVVTEENQLTFTEGGVNAELIRVMAYTDMAYALRANGLLDFGTYHRYGGTVGSGELASLGTVSVPSLVSGQFHPIPVMQGGEDLWMLAIRADGNGYVIHTQYYYRINMRTGAVDLAFSYIPGSEGNRYVPNSRMTTYDPVSDKWFLMTTSQYTPKVFATGATDDTDFPATIPGSLPLSLAAYDERLYAYYWESGIYKVRCYDMDGAVQWTVNAPGAYSLTNTYDGILRAGPEGVHVLNAKTMEAWKITSSGWTRLATSGVSKTATGATGEMVGCSHAYVSDIMAIVGGFGTTGSSSPTEIFKILHGELLAEEFIPTALYVDHQSDTLLAAKDTSVTAVAVAENRREATWKKLFTFERHETLAWLQVESDFLDADGVTAATATITFTKADGSALYSVVVTSRAPVRLPAWREDEVYVQITGTARVSAVKLASTTEEMKAL